MSPGSGHQCRHSGCPWRIRTHAATGSSKRPPQCFSQVKLRSAAGWPAQVVLETDCSEQPGPELPKVSRGDFRDNSLAEKCDEGFLLFPQERQAMLPGECLHRNRDRLLAIADLTLEPGREEGQA